MQRVCRHNHLASRRKERCKRTKPQRRAGQTAQHYHGCELAHKIFRHIIGVVGKSIGPGVHAHQNDGVILFLCRVEKEGVAERTEQCQKEVNLRKGFGQHPALLQDWGQEQKAEHIEKFKQKNGKKLIERGKHIGENFQPAHTVERVGQQPLEKRDLLERVQNSVDTICVFQRKREQHCVKHGRPPAGHPKSFP